MPCRAIIHPEVHVGHSKQTGQLLKILNQCSVLKCLSNLNTLCTFQTVKTRALDKIPEGMQTITSSRSLKCSITSLTILLICRKKSEQVKVMDERIYILHIGDILPKRRLLRG